MYAKFRYLYKDPSKKPLIVEHLELDVNSDLCDIKNMLMHSIQPQQSLILNFSTEGYEQVSETDCEMMKLIFKEMKIQKLEIRFPVSIPDVYILEVLHSLTHIQHKKLVLSVLHPDFLENPAYHYLFIDKYTRTDNPPTFLGFVNNLPRYLSAYTFQRELASFRI